MIFEVGAEQEIEALVAETRQAPNEIPSRLSVGSVLISATETLLLSWRWASLTAACLRALDNEWSDEGMW